MQIFDPEDLERRRVVYMARREAALAERERVRREFDLIGAVRVRFAISDLRHESDALKADLASYNETLRELAASPRSQE